MVSEKSLNCAGKIADGGAGATRYECSMDAATTEPRRISVAIAMSHALAKAAIAQLIGDAEDLVLVPGIEGAQVVVRDLDADANDALYVARGVRGLRGLRGDAAVVGLTASIAVDRIAEELRAGAASVVSTHAPPEELLCAIRAVAAGDMYFDPRIAEILVARLRSRGKGASTGDQRSRFADLSDREQAVLRLVAEGHSGPEIGRLLGITAKTVDTYRHRIQDKIGLAHRRDYIHFALAAGLLER